MQSAVLYSILGMCMIIGILFIYAFRNLNRGWSFRNLFHEFKRKMCMTLCLAIFFTIVYLLIVTAGMYLTKEWGTEFLMLMYRYPVEAVYAGLCLFAIFSLTIYFARMVIKYFYLTRGKDT